MKVIVVNDVTYRAHPIYANFPASKSGKVINVKRLIPMDGHSLSGVQHSLNVAKNMKYLVSRFVWECCNGLIHEIEKVVFHINRNTKDNRLKN